MTVTLVHAADLHIDSPLRGLVRYEGAPVERLRGATRAAFENLVELCISESADLLLIAGDVFDGDWRDYSTGLYFVAQLDRLREVGTRVVLLRGNHDAASHVTKNLRLPEHVRELSHKAPETIAYDELGVAVHGQSFAKRHVEHDMSADYPAPLGGHVNVGMLHTSLNGRPGHDPYAPCHPDQLIAKGYDYWALGHVHQREVVAHDPYIVFPGNLQGRHARETGPKGATVVTIAEGAIQGIDERVLDAVRWQVVEADASGASSADAVIEAVGDAVERAVDDAGGLPLAARVVVSGATAAHAAMQRDRERWEAELRAEARRRSEDVWLEKVRFHTAPEIDAAELRQRGDAIGQLASFVHELRGADDDELLELARDLVSLEIAALPGDPPWASADTLREWIDDVERLVLPRLVSEEGDA